MSSNQPQACDDLADLLTDLSDPLARGDIRRLLRVWMMCHLENDKAQVKSIDYSDHMWNHPLQITARIMSYEMARAKQPEIAEKLVPMCSRVLEDDIHQQWGVVIKILLEQDLLEEAIDFAENHYKPDSTYNVTPYPALVEKLLELDDSRLETWLDTAINYSLNPNAHFTTSHAVRPTEIERETLANLLIKYSRIEQALQILDSTDWLSMRAEKLAIIGVHYLRQGNDLGLAYIDNALELVNEEDSWGDARNSPFTWQILLLCKVSRIVAEIDKYRALKILEQAEQRIDHVWDAGDVAEHYAQIGEYNRAVKIAKQGDGSIYYQTMNLLHVAWTTIDYEPIKGRELVDAIYSDMKHIEEKSSQSSVVKYLIALYLKLGDSETALETIPYKQYMSNDSLYEKVGVYLANHGQVARGIEMLKYPTKSYQVLEFIQQIVPMLDQDEGLLLQVLQDFSQILLRLYPDEWQPFHEIVMEAG